MATTPVVAIDAGEPSAGSVEIAVALIVYVPAPPSLAWAARWWVPDVGAV